MKCCKQSLADLLACPFPFHANKLGFQTNLIYKSIQCNLKCRPSFAV